TVLCSSVRLGAPGRVPQNVSAEHRGDLPRIAGGGRYRTRRPRGPTIRNPAIACGRACDPQ
ncbi:MAG TPA: hypothetical protein VF942_10440, partial [Acidimicrobiales bacterium]